MFEILDYIKAFSDIPEPEAKWLWVQEYERMSVHTREKKPTHILETRRPYEDPEVRQYRIEAYEPVTKSIINRAIQSLQRVFKTGNVDTNISNDLREYIEGNNFEETDLHSYLNKHVLRRMIEDPNGWLVWWPVKHRSELSPSAPQEIQPILVLSKHIVHESDEYATFKSSEKSVVQVMRKDGKGYVDVKEGVVYYILTKEWYYKYQQTGKKEDDEFELIEHYRNTTGQLTYVILGGDEAGYIDESDGKETSYYVSYFSSFLAWGNEAIRQFSDNQGVKTVSGFPIREMSEEVCSDCSGHGFHAIPDPDHVGKTKKETCSTCKGEKFVVPSSPYGVIRRRRGEGMFENGSKDDAPVMRYHNPDPQILQYLREEFSFNLREAEKSLSILFVENTQSGLAKEIDRSQLDAMLDQVGNNLYNSIVLNTLLYISGLRNFTGAEDIQINTPQSYKSKTEQELIEEVTAMKEKKMPSFMIAEVVMELYKKRFNGDPARLKVMKVIAYVDPYFFYDQTEKAVLLASGAIGEDEYRVSTRAPQVVHIYAMNDKDRFMDQEINVISEAIQADLNKPVNRPVLMPDEEEPE